MVEFRSDDIEVVLTERREVRPFELITRSCCNVLVGRDRCEDSAVHDGVSTRPWIVDDDLWALMEPLLPPWPEKAPGPRPVPDRLCLQGILYVLRNDIAWQLLPLELG
ncbi:transposase [Streptomyces sp. NPDC055210]